MCDRPSLPSVLFVCRKNSARSQMAEAWGHHLGQGKITVVSAGLEASTIHPGAIAAMATEGINLGGQHSKPLADFQPQQFDWVISLCGCGYSLPEPWQQWHRERSTLLEWDLPDPAADPALFPSIRDQIRQRIEEFLAGMG